MTFFFDAIRKKTRTFSAPSWIKSPKTTTNLTQKDLDHLNSIGSSLNTRKDVQEFLHMVVKRSRQIVVGDCSCLYLVKKMSDVESKLELFASNFEHETMDLFPKELEINEHSFAGTAISYQQSYRMDQNLHHHPLYPASILEKAAQNYPLQSLICLPLLGSRSTLLGVLLIWNKKENRKTQLNSDTVELILPFSEEDERLLLSIVGQTSIGLENAKLYESISKLFDGFIRASVMAIEARDPSTFGHSERVAKLTVALAKEVHAQEDHVFHNIHFTDRDLRELEYAALLHDFGKIGVRESVLTKAKKLHDFEIESIKDRLDLWRQSVIIEHQKQKIDLYKMDKGKQKIDEKMAKIDQKLSHELKKIDHIFELIVLNNEPSVLSEGELIEIESLLDLNFLRPSGQQDKILQTEQVRRLSIPRGSLSESERKEIELHVNITYQFLNQIPWTADLANVPSIAYAHHEKLDGSGYPRGVRDDQIPYPAKLMTVTDVFDALVARDRPYKKAISISDAVKILHHEADENKLDKNLVNLFVDQKLYRQVTQY
ncbi:MAG: HD domain-containing phosphohydrolase [Bdellovibrionota bacterium]